MSNIHSSSLDEQDGSSQSQHLLKDFATDNETPWASTTSPKSRYLPWILTLLSWLATLITILISSGPTTSSRPSVTKPSQDQQTFNTACYSNSGCRILNAQGKNIGWRAPDFSPLIPTPFIKNTSFMGHATDVKSAWQPLLDVANGGRVHIPDDDEPFFAIAGIHSVHCSWYFLQAVDMAEVGTKPDEELVKHMRHCVEYLRLASMCHADGTLERPFQGQLGSLRGETVHMCRDYGRLIGWAEEMSYAGE